MKVKITKIIDNKTIKGVSSVYKTHNKYGKYVTVNRNYLIHCDCKSYDSMIVGKNVVISQTRPISKNKKWVLID